MKLTITLIIFLFSKIAFAQTSILNLVLNDSLVSHYICNYGGIESDSCVIFEELGCFSYNQGIVELKKQACQSHSLPCGTIVRLKIRQSKATLKMCFNVNDPYYTKVKLRRECSTIPWQIRSRFIYRDFEFKRKQRLLYYSYN